MAQTEKVLRLHDAQLGSAGPDTAHHAPVVALLLGQVEVTHRAGHIFRSGRSHPAVDRLVVMGANIGNAVHRVAVGAVIAAVAAVKAEFQHLHAGVTAFAQQGIDIVGQKAQILGNDAGLTELFLDSGKQCIAGAGAPASALRCFVAVGDGIVPRKSAEVIDAHHIIDSAHVADATNPPSIAVLRHSVPVVERIAPQLPCGGEPVRRAACHLGRVEIGIKLEILRAAPDIDTVKRDIDGQIPDDLDMLVVGVFLQRLPLGVEQVLHSLPKGNVLGIGSAGSL